VKKLILAVVLVALLAAAVFGGQALASSKPADVSVSEETSEILFDWGGSYWGSPLRIQSFEGCFLATDYPDGYSGIILEERYPEVRHVSVTIIASDFDIFGDDSAIIYLYDCVGTNWWIDGDSNWPNVNYKYAVTVTYPR
jgi:hypothetical protein